MPIEPTTVIRGVTDEERLYVASDDYRMADLLASNGLLRDSWLHSPRLRDNIREMDITNHWPLMLGLLWDREDDWGKRLRSMVCDGAGRIWPDHPALCPPKEVLGEPVSGSMVFG